MHVRNIGGLNWREPPNRQIPCKISGYTIYGDHAPFVDQKLQNEREKNDIYQLKGLCQIL